MAERALPRNCPSCGEALVARRFACPACETAVEGAFGLPVLAKLDPAEQDFVLNLLEASGSLKDMAQTYRVSYPTVRNRLDALRAKVRALRAEVQTPNTETGAGTGRSGGETS